MALVLQAEVMGNDGKERGNAFLPHWRQWLTSPGKQPVGAARPSSERPRSPWWERAMLFPFKGNKPKLNRFLGETDPTPAISCKLLAGERET